MLQVLFFSPILTYLLFFQGIYLTPLLRSPSAHLCTLLDIKTHHIISPGIILPESFQSKPCANNYITYLGFTAQVNGTYVSVGSLQEEFKLHHLKLFFFLLLSA